MRRALFLVPVACSLAACGSQHVQRAAPPAGAGLRLRLRRESCLGLPAGCEAEADRALRARARRPEGDDAVPPPAVARAPRARGRRGDLPRVRDVPGPAGKRSSTSCRASRTRCHTCRRACRWRRSATRAADGSCGLRERLVGHRSRARADLQRLPRRADGPAAEPRAARRSHQGADRRGRRTTTPSAPSARTS